MTKNNDLEKIVGSLLHGFLREVGKDLHNTNYVGNDIYLVQALEKQHGKEIVALACLETLVKLDEQKKLADLDNILLGKPGLVINYTLQEASKNFPNALLRPLLDSVLRVSKNNDIFFKILEDTASSWDSEELTKTLRKAYKKSNPIMEPLFKIVKRKASHEAVPILQRLLQDIENDRAYSTKADVRKKFAKEYEQELKKLVQTLCATYSVGSLFEGMNAHVK